MTKPLLLFLSRFIVVTGPLTWWWMKGGQEAYFDFFIWVARDILEAMGVVSFPPSAVRERFMNFVPYLGLIAATPRMALSRRLWGLFVGYLLIFWAQIGLAWWASVCFGSAGLTPEARMRFFPAEMLSDGLPLLLWVVFANEFVSGAFSRVFAPVGQAMAASTPPGSGAPAPPPEAGEEAEAGVRPGEAGPSGADQRSTGQKVP